MYGHLKLAIPNYDKDDIYGNFIELLNCTGAELVSLNITPRLQGDMMYAVFKKGSFERERHIMVHLTHYFDSTDNLSKNRAEIVIIRAIHRWHEVDNVNNLREDVARAIEAYLSNHSSEG